MPSTAIRHGFPAPGRQLNVNPVFCPLDVPALCLLRIFPQSHLSGSSEISAVLELAGSSEAARDYTQYSRYKPTLGKRAIVSKNVGLDGSACTLTVHERHAYLCAFHALFWQLVLQETAYGAQII